MSLFFILNNLHFFISILGAVVFFVMAWLAFDAFLLRKAFSTVSRFLGFSFIAVWQVIHAFQFSSDLVSYLGYLFNFAGLLLILLNLASEARVKRPEFKAILVLPGLSATYLALNGFSSALILLIVVLSYLQYKKEIKKALLPFWLGFFAIFLGSINALFYGQSSLGSLWTLGHGFELFGFILLGWWVWSYLRLRIREELSLILFSITLLMAVVVSITFSSILMDRVETQTKDSLLANTKVLDLAIGRLKEEALAKTRLIALGSELKDAVAKNDFVRLEAIAGNLLESEKLGFLTVADKDGTVIIRAHALTGKDDNLSGERAASKALSGEYYATIESGRGEGFSIRAAAPLMNEGGLVGIIVAGFILDNALVDDISRITGLEMSVFEGNTGVATTIFNTDGKTRHVGVKLSDPKVNGAVLSNGKGITLQTTILSRPYLASYLPLKNSEDKIVGMISASKPQQEILNTVQATNRWTLILVVGIMLILTLPIYFVTKRLSAEII